MAGVIEQYVASLRRELDFDPALARRLASEVEGHLRDAAGADPAWPSPDAEPAPPTPIVIVTPEVALPYWTWVAPLPVMVSLPPLPWNELKPLLKADAL